MRVCSDKFTNFTRPINYVARGYLQRKSNTAQSYLNYCATVKNESKGQRQGIRAYISEIFATTYLRPDFSTTGPSFRITRRNLLSSLRY